MNTDKIPELKENEVYITHIGDGEYLFNNFGNVYRDMNKLLTNLSTKLNCDVSVLKFVNQVVAWNNNEWADDGIWYIYRDDIEKTYSIRGVKYTYGGEGYYNGHSLVACITIETIDPDVSEHIVGDLY